MNLMYKKCYWQKIKKIFSFFTFITFLSTSIIPPSFVSAQITPQTILNLPIPGTILSISGGFTPPLIKGLTINPENALEFDFIVYHGDDNLQGQELKQESLKLIKYFMASLTTPEKEMWVNLSPYESDRIIPTSFGQTEMGRDLLAQDYILKQLTASLMYPEDELGAKFWKNIYKKAYEQFGTTEIPINTFNKVWIVPSKAVVYEHEGTALIVDQHLKVMLEEDYLAMEKNAVGTGLAPVRNDKNNIATQIIREILIPEIEREVNQGKNFANLRQIYNSMILAAWYKQNLKESLLGQVYVDKNKVKGVDVEDKEIKQKIYQQYLEAFKKGVYNYIKEDIDFETQEMIPRKYFSGGMKSDLENTLQTIDITSASPILDQVEEVSSAIEGEDHSTVVMSALSMGNNSISTAEVEKSFAPQRRSSSSLLMDKPKQKVLGYDSDWKIADHQLDRFMTKLQSNPDKAYADLFFEILSSELANNHDAQMALGRGGLGYLMGEHIRKIAENIPNKNGFGVGILNKLAVVDGKEVEVPWDEVEEMNEFMVIKNGKEVQLEFDVEFNGRTYKVSLYWMEANGTPIFFMKSDIFEQIYPGLPGGKEQTEQFGFYARAYVELMKHLNLSPSIVRLSEGHMVFVPNAMQNDIDFSRSVGKKSVHEDSKIVFTTHTPEPAAVMHWEDFEWLKSIVGKDLVWRFEELVENGVLSIKSKDAGVVRRNEFNQSDDIINTFFDDMTKRGWAYRTDKDTLKLEVNSFEKRDEMLEVFGEEKGKWIFSVLERAHENGEEKNSLNALEALAYFAKQSGGFTNAVSEEHAEVTEVILSRAQNEQVRKELMESVVGIRNGSEKEIWNHPELQRRIDKKGIIGITVTDLIEVMHIAKEELNKELKADGFNTFKDIQGRPLIALLRRIVYYKQQGIFIDMVEWITGNRDKEYDTSWLTKLDDEYDAELIEQLGIDRSIIQSRMKGLGANLLIGGLTQDDIGRKWGKEFERLENTEGLKGKFIYVPKTGNKIMQAVTRATNLWGAMPLPFREAAGTGHERVNQITFLTDGAAHTIQITDQSGRVLKFEIPEDLKQKIMQEEEITTEENFRKQLIWSFIERKDKWHRDLVKVFQDEAKAQMADAFIKDINDFYNDQEAWGKKILDSFRRIHIISGMDLNAQKYGRFFDRVSFGEGIEGFQGEMKEMDEEITNFYNKVQQIFEHINNIRGRDESIKIPGWQISYATLQEVTGLAKDEINQIIRDELKLYVTPSGYLDYASKETGLVAVERQAMVKNELTVIQLQKIGKRLDEILSEKDEVNEDFQKELTRQQALVAEAKKRQIVLLKSDILSNIKKRHAQGEIIIDSKEVAEELGVTLKLTKQFFKDLGAIQYRDTNFFFVDIAIGFTQDYFFYRNPYKGSQDVGVEVVEAMNIVVNQWFQIHGYGTFSESTFRANMHHLIGLEDQPLDDLKDLDGNIRGVIKNLNKISKEFKEINAHRDGFTELKLYEKVETSLIAIFRRKNKQLEKYLSDEEGISARKSPSKVYSLAREFLRKHNFGLTISHNLREYGARIIDKLGAVDKDLLSNNLHKITDLLNSFPLQITHYFLGAAETSYLSRLIQGLNYNDIYEKVNRGDIEDLRKYLEDNRKAFGIDEKFEIVAAEMLENRQIHIEIGINGKTIIQNIGYDTKQTNYKDGTHLDDRQGNYFSIVDYVISNLLKIKDLKGVVTKAHDAGNKVIMDFIAWRSSEFLLKHPEAYKYFEHRILYKEDTRTNKEVLEQDGGVIVPLGNRKRAVVHLRGSAQDQLKPDINSNKKEVSDFWREHYLGQLKYYIDIFDVDGFRVDLMQEISSDGGYSLIQNIFFEAIRYAEKKGRKIYFTMEMYDNQKYFRDWNQAAGYPAFKPYDDRVEKVLNDHKKDKDPDPNENSEFRTKEAKLNKLLEVFHELINSPEEALATMTIWGTFDDYSWIDMIQDETLRKDLIMMTFLFAKTGRNAMIHSRDLLGLIGEIMSVAGGKRVGDDFWTHKPPTEDELSRIEQESLEGILKESDFFNIFQQIPVDDLNVSKDGDGKTIVFSKDNGEEVARFDLREMTQRLHALASSSVVGGIDFNTNLLDLQIKRDGNGIPLPISQQPLESMNIEGFLPVIINIFPVQNLPMLLGFNDFDSIPISSCSDDEENCSSVSTAPANKFEDEILL